MTARTPDKLLIGGVPEHFNMPWHLAIESGAAESCGLACAWQDYSTGTGAMLADLAEGRLDLAVLLTEGAALGLARGLPIEAVSLYTTSPLIWGIHVAPDAPMQSVGELAGCRFAISRHGSGSHLMSLALAIDQGWPVDALRFEIVDDLSGAIAAFREDRADVFLWEHYTTEPAVQSGHFRRIADFVSPWPAWVVCANTSIRDRHRTSIEALLRAIAATATELSRMPDAADRIAARYGLEAAAVADWLSGVEWVAELTPPQSALTRAQTMLEAAGAIR